MLHRHMLKANKRQLAYWQSGAGENTTLFLHGFPETKEMWLPYLTAMPSRRPEETFVALDLPGYGQSELLAWPNATFDAAVIDTLHDFITAISPRPIHLVAHDWGGVVGWILLHRYPHLFRGATLIAAPQPDVFLATLASDDQQKRASSYIPVLASPDGAAACRKGDFAFFREELFTPAVGLSDQQRYAYLAAWSEAGRIEDMIWYYQSYFPVHVPCPPPQDVPIHVIWAGRDKALLPPLADELSRRFPYVRVSFMPDAPHWAPHTHKAEVTDMLTSDLEASATRKSSAAQPQ